MPEADELSDDEIVVEKPETEVEQPEAEEAAEEKPEAEEGAETEEGEEEQPAPSRRENRVQALARRTREAEDRALRAEVERDALKNTRQPQTNPDEARRIRDEKLALMDPQERRDFLRDEELKELKNGMAFTRFQMQDSVDKNGFQAEIRGNAALEKMAPEVERLYADALKNGNFVPRLSLLDYVIGKQAREKLKQPASKSVQAARKEARDRVDSVKAKPMSVRSDAKGSKGDSDSLEAIRDRIAAEERRRGLRD